MPPHPPQTALIPEGSWLLVYWLYDGRDPHTSDAPIILSFLGEKFTIRIGNKITEEGVFEGLEPERSPKAIVYAPSQVNGEPVNEKYPGIYILADDVLVLCIGYAGERPKAFSAEAGSHNELVIYKRLNNGLVPLAPASGERPLPRGEGRKKVGASR
jgi:uncharacterized protein (TIGR03067 family)